MPTLPPPPRLQPGTSGDLVTLTVAEVTALSKWIIRARDVDDALRGCTLVVRTDH